MDALIFLGAFWVIVLTLWILGRIGSAFDRTTRHHLNRYDYVAERKRNVDRRAFKSRMGV